MLNLAYTFGAALLCGLLLRRLGVPGGMMVGAIVGAVAVNLLGGAATMPYAARFTAQTVAGAFIGCSVRREDLRRLPRLLKPAAVQLGAVLLLNVALGFLIWLCSPLDLVTALMSAVPGGMSDIPIIAADMGADTGKVALLQFVRMSAGIAVFPSAIVAYDRRCRRAAPADAPAPAPCPAPFKAPDPTRQHALLCLALTAAAALAGGLLGRATGLPAAVLVGSMFAVIALGLSTGRAWMPGWVRRLAQVLSGAYIGCGMGLDDLVELPHLLLPAGLILAGYALNCFVTGGLLHRHFGLERKEAMLAATPAGATDMALISADVGVQSTDLIVLQIVRMVVVIAVFPQLIRLIVMLVGG